jgi:hypothetical protein
MTRSDRPPYRKQVQTGLANMLSLEMQIYHRRVGAFPPAAPDISPAGAAGF